MLESEHKAMMKALLNNSDDEMDGPIVIPLVKPPAPSPPSKKTSPQRYDRYAHFDPNAKRQPSNGLKSPNSRQRRSSAMSSPPKIPKTNAINTPKRRSSASNRSSKLKPMNATNPPPPNIPKLVSSNLSTKLPLNTTNNPNPFQSLKQLHQDVVAESPVIAVHDQNDGNNNIPKRSKVPKPKQSKQSMKANQSIRRQRQRQKQQGHRPSQSPPPSPPVQSTQSAQRSASSSSSLSSSPSSPKDANESKQSNAADNQSQSNQSKKFKKETIRIRSLATDPQLLLHPFNHQSAAYNDYNPYQHPYNHSIPSFPAHPPYPAAPNSGTSTPKSTTSTLRANAMEFVPQHYNPYLTPENAHTANPYEVSTHSSHYNYNQYEEEEEEAESKLNVEEELLENPEAFNEDDYEVFEDENGEIIVVEKDQLYGDDPQYQQEQAMRGYGDELQNGRNGRNKKDEEEKEDDDSMQNQRGLREGGGTYVYGQRSPRRNRKNKKKSSSNGNQSKPNPKPKAKAKAKAKAKGKRPKSKSRGRSKGKQSKYALMAAKHTEFEGLEYKEDPEAEEKETTKNSAQICRFWLNGQCKYAQHCHFKHRFDNDTCPHCDKCVHPQMQDQHLKQCWGVKSVEKEVQQSQDAECGICKEGVLERGHKFGLLTGCNHAFCLPCIREWRGVLHQKKEAVRACPMCRKMTWFIVPCDRLVTEPERKREIFEKYKDRLSKIRCKHFDRSEECPFGSSCFYQHVRKDGTVDEKKVNLRHIFNEDGEVEVMKDSMLSDFLFGPDQ